jgi:ssDNA-binding Zn-finger/Zn-ribbon topoisomerase 1
MKSATHIGTCQVCGSVQMLPISRTGKSLLAKHGYVVEYGWGFQGVCQGSGHLPFEQSCEYTKKITAEAEASIAAYDPAADIRPVPPANCPTKGERFCNPEELEILKEWQGMIRPWNARQNNHKNLLAFVAFQKPRIAGWSIKPLTERPNEAQAKQQRKDRVVGVRAASKRMDYAKRDLTKLMDLAESFGSRWDDQLIKFTSYEAWSARTREQELANNKVNAPIYEKQAMLRGNINCVNKVVASIRALFNEQRELDVASDLEIALREYTAAKEEYLRLKA